MFLHTRHAFLDNYLGDRLDDSGVVTPEYAIVMVIAASMAFAMWLITNSEQVKQGLSGLVERALDLSG